jgi:hypothetical protein
MGLSRWASKQAEKKSAKGKTKEAPTDEKTMFSAKNSESG